MNTNCEYLAWHTIWKLLINKYISNINWHSLYFDGFNLLVEFYQDHFIVVNLM